MRRGVKGLEDSHSKDQLTWLVLRVVAGLAPCTKTSLIAYVSGGDSTSELRRELILNALLRLQTLAFIQFVREQIAITDKGRRFLEELPVVALRPRKPYVARLRALVSTLLAESLIQYCQDCLAGARAIAQRSFQINGGRARDIVLQKMEAQSRSDDWVQSNNSGSYADATRKAVPHARGSLGHCSREPGKADRSPAMEGCENPWHVPKHQACGLQLVGHRCWCFRGGCPVDRWGRRFPFGETCRA